MFDLGLQMKPDQECVSEKSISDFIVLDHGSISTGLYHLFKAGADPEYIRNFCPYNRNSNYYGSHVNRRLRNTGYSADLCKVLLFEKKCNVYIEYC